MNASYQRGLRATAVASLQSLDALLTEPMVSIRLCQDCGLPYFAALCSSLDLLAAAASELAMTQPENVHCDFEIEPFQQQSLDEIVEMCIKFVDSVLSIVESNEPLVDWASIGVRSQTFSAVIGSKGAE